MRCAACGAENAVERRFCTGCGAPLGTICPACSFSNEASARFCGGCGAPLAAAPASLAEPVARAWPQAERRQLTLLFCDLCQSTALSDRLDPEDMRDVLEAYRRRCTAAIGRYNGTIAYYMGDGILAYFGYPTAHEDDAIRAVRAALEIVPAVGSLGRGWATPLPLPLRVRIAIHTGLVVAGEIALDARRSELWAVGRAPNIAARLQILAEPDAIVVSGATHRLLSGRFAATPLGRHELAGIDETIEVLRIERELPGAATGAELPDEPLVNREAELAFLEQCWAHVREGSGRAVLLSGDSGIGKSRLVRALITRLRQAEHQVLLFQCSAYFAETPLHPVIEHLRRAAGILVADSDERRLERIERLVGSRRERIPDLVEILADLLGVTQDRYRALAMMAPAERRARTLDALSSYVLVLAAERPAIAIFEDLHWADPTTREWLGQLFGRLAAGPLLGLVALRADFQPEWADLDEVTRLPLERLTRDDCARIVERVMGRATLASELKERILGATDGVPLFVEELTKALLEAGMPAGTETQPVAPEALAIPTTIQDSLTARLDRLGDAKRVAQVAATIGREFSREVLAEVTGLPAAALDAALERLIQSGLVLRPAADDHSLAFKHALVRDAAYGGLLHRTRRELHGRIVEVLERSFPSVIAASPELAARHATEARAFEPAVRYWLQAGRQAIARAAHHEAVSHLEHALACLRHLPDTAAAAARRLECLVTLGPSLILTQGPGAQRVEAVYREAVELCQRVEPSLDHVAAFWGWWRISPSHAEMRGRAEQLLVLAQRLQAPAVLLQAHHCLWATQLEVAEFEDALGHIEQGIALYGRGDFADHADYFGGHDAKVCGRGAACFALWHLGLPERALRSCLDGLEWAERLGHAGSILHALDIAVTFRRYRREPDAARELANRMIAFGRERGLNDHLAKGELYLGWTVAVSGEAGDGIAMVERAFATERAAGTPEDFPIYADLLGELLLMAGKAERALEEIDRAIAESEAGDRRIWLPELHRRRGLIMQALRPPRADEAEASFALALSLARSQRSLSLELRAAGSTARLWHLQGRVEAARDLLDSVYRRFSEGFATPDLRDARLLLDGLSVQGGVALGAGHVGR